MKSINHESLVPAVIGAFILFSPAVGHADNCAGHDILHLRSADKFELSKGHTQTLLRFDSVVVADDSASPVHLTAGECSGIVMTTPEGVTQGSGFCIRKNNAGDSYSVVWTLPPGATKFNWKHIGGTGIYVNSAEYGTSWGLDLAAGSSMNVNRWSGNCK